MQKKIMLSMLGFFLSGYANGANAAEVSLWNNTTIPAVVAQSDTRSIEVGVKFSSTVAGYVNGIRYYKGLNNVGLHRVSLWNADGTVLATGTATAETKSGCQTVRFATPVAIQANRTYIASYHTSGHYAMNTYYFNAAYSNGVLRTPVAAGVYVIGTSTSLFPSNVWQNSNYWVDVAFTAGTTSPTAVNGVCGTSNAGTFATKPTANLCSVGTASAVSGSGPWSWSCAGSNGGSTASCSAKLQSTAGILRVGAGQTYPTIAAAMAKAVAGNTILVSPGTYNDNPVEVNVPISIVAANGPGTVLWQATTFVSNRKGMLVTNVDTVVDGLTIANVKVSDNDGGNGAAVRYQAGNLTLRNVYFHDNQNGLLGNAAQNGTITISKSWFDHNGSGVVGSSGYGFTHNLYVGQIAKLDIQDSLFTNAVVGHEIKSRAAQTTVNNTRIVDGANGSASYNIDLPYGGKAVITNNQISKSPVAGNPIIITSGEEGAIMSNSNLTVSNNLIVNKRVSPSTLALKNNTGFPASITGNRFYGVTAAQVASGVNTQSANTFLTTEPAISTAAPWAP